MRILVIGSKSRDTAASSVAHVLRERHEVSEFDYQTSLIPFGYGKLNRLNAAYLAAARAAGSSPAKLADRRLLAFARGKRFDLVFTVSITLLQPATVARLRELTGALVVGWFQDAIVNLGDARFLEAPYEKVFFKDRVVVERFRIGLASDRYEYLPQAFDPDLHRPMPASQVSEPNADVATFGNSYTYRAVLMRELLEQRDIETVVYGLPTGNPSQALLRVYRPPVFGVEKSLAMLRARVALNTNHFAEIGGINKRTFELGGIGACQLTDAAEIARYFEPEREVLTFSGPHELVEKVRLLLADEALRHRLARAGLTRAWAEHTYQHRVNQIFDSVPALRSERRLTAPTLPLDGDGPKLTTTGGTLGAR